MIFFARYRARGTLYTIDFESERHTAVNIAKWTKEALESIGLTEAGLLGEEE